MTNTRHGHLDFAGTDGRQALLLAPRATRLWGKGLGVWASSAVTRVVALLVGRNRVTD